MAKFSHQARPVEENPFYGMPQTLNLLTSMGKLDQSVNESSVKSMLNSAYSEAKTLEKKALFYSLVFAMGDIPNREHNVFSNRRQKKVDNGGQGKRKAFFYALKWMLTYSKETTAAFYQLMPLIGEYTNVENLFYNQIRTDRYKGTVTEVMSLPIDIDLVTTYIADVLKDPHTTDMTKTLWAKFLKAPRFRNREHTYTIKPGTEARAHKRTGNYNLRAGDSFTTTSNMLAQTREKERFEETFIKALSKKMGWAVVEYETNVRYKGLMAFKSAYNQESEAVLFSTKRILKFDSIRFFEWLDKLPGGARNRVQHYLFNKDKSGNRVSTGKWVGEYGDLAEFYLVWENSKAQAQQEVRNLENKLATQGTLTIDESTKLKQSRKEAKVNTGGEDLVSIVKQLATGQVNGQAADAVAEQLMRKMKLEAPVLVFGDASESMNRLATQGMSSRQLMNLMVTAFLMKNPDPELSSMVGLFTDRAIMLTDGDFKASQPRQNSLLMRSPAQVFTEKLVDKTQSFMTNFARMSAILNSNITPSNTDIQSVARMLKEWANQYPDQLESRKEIINKYPVWMFISDTEFNNASSVQVSINKFRQDMLQFFGWNGVIVLWDVRSADAESNNFEGVDNTIHLSGFNVSIANQVFTNVTDFDVIDVFTPLLTTYRSNRYEAVREAILNKGVLTPAM